MAVESNLKIAALYCAIFKRAPDQDGLNYWLEQMSQGGDLVDIATGFTAHPAFTELYGDMNNREFIETFYVNVLGNAGDEGGIQYWTDKLDAGETRAEVVASFVEGSMEVDLDAMLALGQLTQAEYEVAVMRQEYILNKAEVGVYFAETLGDASNLDSSTYTATIEGLESDPAYLLSQQVLVNVDKTDSSVAAAKAAIDALETSTGTVFTLKQSTADVTAMVTVTGEKIDLDAVSVTKETYWGDPSANSGEGEGVPVAELVALITQHFSQKQEILELFDFTDDLAEITNITLAGVLDELQDESDVDTVNVDDGDSSASVGNDGNATVDDDSGYVEVKEGDYTGDYSVTVTFADSTTLATQVTLTQDEIAFFESVLFITDATAGTQTPRLFEVTTVKYPEVILTDLNGNPVLDADGNPITYQIDSYTQEDIEVEEITGQEDTPLILTTTQNNGSTEETAALTTGADDVIVAGRLDLLHQAYIDGGAGENTLEIDAKGYYAQPKALVNIDHISIQNLPNVYTDQTDGSVNYPDLVNVGSDPTPYDDSIIDISRALDLDTLTISASDFESLGEGSGAIENAGDLTVVGIRNGAELTLDGNFANDSVYLNYRETADEGLNLTLNNVNFNGGLLSVAHNAPTLNIESAGGSNVIQNANLGSSSLTELNVTGDAQLFINTSLATTFVGGHPAEIDASGNTAGVDLSLSGHDDDVVFIGTASSNDHFTALSVGGSATVTAGDGNGEYSVDAAADSTVTVGEGDNEISALAGNDVVVTAADGNNEITATSSGAGASTGDNEDTVTVTVGDGQNDITATSADGFYITAGDGDNRIEATSAIDSGVTESDVSTIVVGDGQNEIDATAGQVSVTTGTGDNEVAVQGTAVTVETDAGNDVIEAVAGVITIDSAAGNDVVTVAGNQGAEDTFGGAEAVNLMLVLDDSSSMAGQELADQKAAINALLDEYESAGVNVAVKVYSFSSTVENGGSNEAAWISAADARTVVNALAATGGTDFDEVLTDIIADAPYAETDGYISNGANVVVFTSDGQSSLSTGTVSQWESFLRDNDSVANAFGIGSGADLTQLDEVAYDGLNEQDLDAIAVDDSADLADTIVETVGSLSVGNQALVNIDLGEGTNTLEIGDANELSQGLVALEGSSITGSDIKLVVNADSDLRAASLDGITSVVLDNADIGSADKSVVNAQLTLTSDQFMAIGAENFSVEGSIFNTYAQVKVIVTETMSLSDLGVDALERNIDLLLEVQDGVTLSMTAQQLHEKVAIDGVTLADDGNTDLANGLVEITSAGQDFDPFNSSDTVKSDINGTVYFGGSLSDDFMVDGAWYNVDLQAVYKGYDRPVDVPREVVFTIDADILAGEPVEDIQSWHTNVEVIGNEDVTFDGVLQFGDQVTAGEDGPFTIDFSELDGEAIGMTVDNFEHLAQGGGIYGNGASQNTEVLIHLADDTSDGVGFDESDAGSLVSHGVARYVVTKIDGSTNPGSGSTATIKLCDTTQDLEVLALRGNYNDTLNVVDAAWGLIFELQGGSLLKSDGPTATANVGALDANFMWEGSDAVVNMLHSLDTDTRPVATAGIDIDNAASITINGPATGISVGDINGNSVETITINVDGDASIGFDGIPTTVETIDATGVTGTTTLELAGTNDLSSVALDGVDAINVNAGLTTLTKDQIDAIGLANITVADSAALDTYVPEGVTLDLPYAEFKALDDLGVIKGAGTVNITGLTQADVDAGLDLDSVTVANLTLAIAEDIVLSEASDLGTASVIVPDATELSIATHEQAQGLVVDGGTDSTITLLFSALDTVVSGTDDFAADFVDAAGFDVSFLRFQDLLVVGTNVDETIQNLLETVTKVMYNNSVELMDQTATVEAGSTVRGDLTFARIEDDSELENVTLNLEGGVEVEGSINLASTVKDSTLIQSYLESLTINSTGTEGNLQSGDVANIITGSILTTIVDDNGTPSDTSDDVTMVNELREVTINADQDLEIQGTITFSAIHNDDAAANLTVTGTADVTLGTLDTADTDVDALNVINEGTGTLTVGINAANIDAADALSFTGTGAIVLNIAGSVDLSDDVLDAVTALNIAASSTATITSDQMVALGEANITGTGTVSIVEHSTQVFDSTAVEALTINVTTAAGEYTLDSGSDLSDVDAFTFGSDSVVTMTGAQALQLASATITANATAEVHIIDVTQADLDAGLGTVLTAMGIALATNGSIGSVTFSEDVTLTGSELNIATSEAGFELIGSDTRVNVNMDTTPVGTSDVLGIKSQGITDYVVTEAAESAVEGVIYVCNNTEGLETLGLQENAGYEIEFAGIKRGVDFVMEGDGVADWSEVEKIQDSYNTSDIGELVATFYTPDNPSSTVTINNQGTELATSSDPSINGGERILTVDGVTILNTIALTVDVQDGDAVIGNINGGTLGATTTIADTQQLESLTLTAVEDLTVTMALPTTLTSIDATGVTDAFVATLVDMADAFSLTTGADATITLNAVTADAGTSIDGAAGELDLIVTATDLSAATLNGVDSVSITTGSNVTLNADQVVAIDEANINGVEGGAAEVLNINGLSTQEIVAADLGTDVDLGTVTMAAGSHTLTPATDLTGANLVVPADGSLTLTADQYMALADLDGIAPTGDEVAANITITGVTQAHVDAGFDLNGISNATGTVEFVGDIELPTPALGSPDQLAAFAVEMTSGVLTLTNSVQADGLDVTGTEVVLKFIMLDAATVTGGSQIDASAYNIDTLTTIDQFYTVAQDIENAEFVIDELDQSVTLVVMPTPEDLGLITDVERTVIVQEDATLPGEFVFNDIDVTEELVALNITLQGNATITSNLRIPTVDASAQGIPDNFDRLTITSEGTSANNITGMISGAAAGTADPASATELENNLLNIDITATQDLNIGQIEFTSIADNGSAELNVDASTGNVVIGDLDTDDEQVDALVVNHTGDGALTFGLSTVATVDATDVITVNGSATGTTTIIVDTDAAGTNGPDLDLSDDTLVNVDAVVLVDDSALKLTLDQLTDIGLAQITNDDTTDANIAQLDIVGLDDSEFDAVTDLQDQVEIRDITIASGGTVTLHADTDLTGVASLNVPAGTTLNLTAAQFNQLDNAGTITGAGTVNITNLTQADVDAGFDVSGITDALQGTITLEEDVILDPADTVLDMFAIELTDGQTIQLSNNAQADGRTITGTDTSTVKLGFTVAVGVPAIDSAAYDFGELFVLEDLVNQQMNVEELLPNLASEINVTIFAADGTIVPGATPTMRTVDVEAGTTVDDGAGNPLSFNDLAGDAEVTHLSVTLEGDARIEDGINLATVTPGGPAPGTTYNYFQTLTIESEGTGANSIGGMIDAAAGTGTAKNNLLDIDVTATEDLSINNITFSALNDEADAALDVEVAAGKSVSITDLNTVDANVDTLTVTQTDNGVDPVGTLEIGLNATNTAGTELTIDGSALGQTTINATGALDLSDDTLANIDLLNIADNSTVTLTTTQYNAIGAVDGTGVMSDLVITNYNGEAINLIPDGTDVNITLNLAADAGTVTLDPTALDLSQVSSIVVPAGTTLELTADQYQSLPSTTLITGAGTVNLTEFDSSNGDIDVANINTTTQGTITLDSTDASVLVLKAAVIENFGFVMSANDQTLTLSKESDVDGLVVDSGAFTGTELIFGFTTFNGAAGEDGYVAASGYDVANVRLLDDYINFVGDGTAADYNYEERLVDLSGDVTIIVDPQVGANIDPAAVTTIVRNIIISENADVDENAIFNDSELTGTDAYASIEVLNLTMQGNASIDGDVNLGITAFTQADAAAAQAADNFVAVLAASDFADYATALIAAPASTTTDADEAAAEAADALAALIAASTFADYAAALAADAQAVQDAANGGSLETVNIVSEGTSQNVITGNVVAEGNMLMDVNIQADQDLVIGTYLPNGDHSADGDIVFESPADSQTVTLDIEGTANVTMHGVDITDADAGNGAVGDIFDVIITNNAGTLTMTGGTAAVAADNAEQLVLGGTGNMVFGSDAVDGEGVESNTLSVINATGLTGTLDLGEITDVDSADFAFTAGTGATTLTLSTDTLNAAGTWTFDLSAPTAPSELYIDGQAMTFNAGTLNIDLGANGTLYINSDTDLSALASLNITQTNAIVVANGATLTLTAAQADGLNIVGESGAASTGVVNIESLGTDAYDLTGISADIAGTTFLASNDVTLDAGTLLGNFSVSLVDLDNASDTGPLQGQVIRFQDETQAGREIIVIAAAETAQDRSVVVETDTGSNVDTSVVWLFDSLTDPNTPVNTDAYDSDLGRLWLNQTLANGANIEELFTDLDNSIVRVEFEGLQQLADALASSTGHHRVVELVAFTNLPQGLDFSDEDDLSHVNELTLELGGNVTVGDIMLDNIIDLTDTNPIPFGAVVNINSRLMDNQNHYLAPVDFVDGTHVPPTAINTIGDIGVGVVNNPNSGDDSIDLMTVNVSTGVTADDDENGVSIQTITYNSGTPLSTANFIATGDQPITVKSLDTSDANINTLTVTTTGYAGTLTVTGGSPAAAVTDTEVLNITMSDPSAVAMASTVIFGSADTTDGLGEFAGINGPDLSEINIVGEDGDVLDLGIAAQIDSLDFTVNGDNDVETTLTLGEANVDGTDLAPELAAGGTWTINLGNDADTELHIDGTTTFGAGTFSATATTVSITGTVDFTQLTSLTITDVSGNTTPELVIEAGAELIVTAAQAHALNMAGIGGEGTLTIVDLESDVDGNAGNGVQGAVLNNVADTVTIEATIDTTAGNVEFASGDFAHADIDVTGGNTADVTAVTLSDTTTLVGGGALAEESATFAVATGTTVLMLASQADGRETSGAGTTYVEDLNEDAAANLAGLGTDAVTVDVLSTTTFTGTLSPVATTTVNVLGVATDLIVVADKVDGYTVTGDGEIIISATAAAENSNFDNFTVENITFDAADVVGTIDFPTLSAAQTVTMTAVQASGQTIDGLGNVTVNDVDAVDANTLVGMDINDAGSAMAATAIDLASITATGTLTAIVDADEWVNTGTDFGLFKVQLADGVDLALTIDQLLATGEADFSGTAVGPNAETLVVTEYDGEDIGALGADLSISVLNLVAGTAIAPEAVTLGDIDDLANVQTIFVPEHTTLTMTAEQFEELEAFGTTITGTGTVNLTEFDSAAGDSINLSDGVVLTAGVQHGTISLDPAVAGANTSVLVTEDATLDLIGANSFTWTFTANEQTLVLSSETQADGRAITDNDSFTDSRVVLGFDNEDATDGDSAIDAENFDFDMLWILDSFVANIGSGGSFNYEDQYPNLASGVVIHIFDELEDGIDFDLSPGAITTTNRTVIIEEGVTVLPDAVFNDTDPNEEVATLDLTFQGGSTLDGDLELPTTVDTDDTPLFFQKLTINSEVDAANPTAGNVLNGAITAGSGAPGATENNLLDVEINADQDLTITDEIEFSSVAQSESFTMNLADGFNIAAAGFVNFTFDGQTIGLDGGVVTSGADVAAFIEANWVATNWTATQVGATDSVVFERVAVGDLNPDVDADDLVFDIISGGNTDIEATVDGYVQGFGTDSATANLDITVADGVTVNIGDLDTDDNDVDVLDVDITDVSGGGTVIAGLSTLATIDDDQDNSGSGGEDNTGIIDIIQFTGSATAGAVTQLNITSSAAAPMDLSNDTLENIDTMNFGEDSVATISGEQFDMLQDSAEGVGLDNSDDLGGVLLTVVNYTGNDIDTNTRVDNGDITFTTFNVTGASRTVTATDLTSVQTLNIAAGIIVQMTAAQAHGLTAITGDGAIQITDLESDVDAGTPGVQGADLTNVADTIAITATIDTTAGNVEFASGEFAHANITVIGGNTADVSSVTFTDAAAPASSAQFTVDGSGLTLTAEQADGRTVNDGTAPGTTNIEDLGAHAGGADVDYSTVATTNVNFAVDSSVALDEADELGAASATRIITVATGQTLTADSATIDGQYVQGLGTLEVDDHADGIATLNADIATIGAGDSAAIAARLATAVSQGIIENADATAIQTAYDTALPTFEVADAQAALAANNAVEITADLSNVSADIIALVADALTTTGNTITFPITDATQTVIMTAVQADGKVVSGLGDVTVNDVDATTAQFSLAGVTATGTLQAHVDSSVALHELTDLGSFDVILAADGINPGLVLTLTVQQLQAAGEGDFFGTAGGAIEKLHVTNYNGEAIADLGNADIEIDVLTTAAGTVTLGTIVDLADIDTINITGELTMTVDQFLTLTAAPTSVTFVGGTLNLTGLTQAHVDAGLDLDAATAGVTDGTLTLAENNIVLDGVGTDATNLSEFTLEMADNQQITLSNQDQADGRDFALATGASGTGVTVILGFDTMTGTQMDMSGYGVVNDLYVEDLLVENYAVSNNVENLLEDLPGGAEPHVHLFSAVNVTATSTVTTNELDLAAYATIRQISIEANTDIDGGLAVIEIDDLGGISHLTLNMDGNASITGDLDLSAGNIGTNTYVDMLQTLTINSTDSTFTNQNNVITGSILADASGIGDENNLTDITINAEEQLTVGEDIVFSSVIETEEFTLTIDPNIEVNGRWSNPDEFSFTDPDADGGSTTTVQLSSGYEEFTITFAGNVDQDDTVEFDSTVVTLDASTDQQATAEEFANEFNAAGNLNWFAAYNPATATVTMIAQNDGDVLDTDYEPADFTVTSGNSISVATAKDVDGYDRSQANIAIAAQIAAAFPSAEWTVTDNLDGTLSFEAVTPGDWDNISSGDFSWTDNNSTSYNLTSSANIDRQGDGDQEDATLTVSGDESVIVTRNIDFTDDALRNLTITNDIDDNVGGISAIFFVDGVVDFGTGGTVENNLIIEGSGESMTLDGVDAEELLTINSSAYTGELTIGELTGLDADNDTFTFTGGTGDTDVTIGAATLEDVDDWSFVFNAAASSNILTFNSAFNPDMTGQTNANAGSLTITEADTVEINANVDFGQLVTSTGDNQLTVTATTTYQVNGGSTLTMRADQADGHTFTSNVSGSATGNLVTEAWTGTSGVSITGTANDDDLSGSAGNDTLNGGAGDDDITGGAGIDSLTGGTGNDDFNFVAGDTGQTLATADTIVDFTPGAGADLIELDGIAATNAGGAVNGAGRDEATFLAAAATAFTGVVNEWYYEYDANSSGDAWVMVDKDGDGAVSAGDLFIVLTGINTAALDTAGTNDIF